VGLDDPRRSHWETSSKNNSCLIDFLLPIIFQGDQTMAPLSIDTSPSTYELSPSSYLVSLLFTYFSSISKVVWIVCSLGECTVEWFKNGKNYNPYESKQDFFK
jgi:hypothetical protein